MRWWLLALCVSFSGLAPEAFAGPAPTVAPVPADAGLAVSVSGTVTYKGASAAAEAPVTAYMKLRVGDVVQVPAGGRVEVLYFAGGRREAWDGAASFVVEADKGLAKTGQATTQEQGETVGRSLENLPIMLRQAQSYQAGQTLVRGGDASTAAPVPLDEAEKAQVAEAWTVYEVLRTNAKPDDVFPEMYLVSVLLPLGLDDDSAKVLEQAVAKCPTCTEPKVLLDWINARRAH